METKDGLTIGEDGKARCWWYGDKPDYMLYHDREWGAAPLAMTAPCLRKSALKASSPG